MFLALVLVAALGWFALGGAAGIAGSLSAVNPDLLEPLVDAGTGQAPGLIGVVSLLGWGLGYFGQPHILARFMAAQAASSLPLARRIDPRASGHPVAKVCEWRERFPAQLQNADFSASIIGHL